MKKGKKIKPTKNINIVINIKEGMILHLMIVKNIIKEIAVQNINIIRKKNILRIIIEKTHMRRNKNIKDINNKNYQDRDQMIRNMIKNLMINKTKITLKQYNTKILIKNKEIPIIKKIKRNKIILLLID